MRLMRHGPIKLWFRHKKEEAFRLLFLMLYSFRLRMLLGFRSLIANNDELRRIKEEFFQKAASSAVSLCPVSCECMLRGSSAVVPMFAPSPRARSNIPLNALPSRHYAFHLRNRLFLQYLL